VETKYLGRRSEAVALSGTPRGAGRNERR